MNGALFETFVIGEIMKSYYNAGRRPPVYFYRDRDGSEIDLLIEENGTLFPIEIKLTGNVELKAIRHFSKLDDIPAGPAASFPCRTIGGLSTAKTMSSL
jgi:predicted AAA+ superfamily ATPase